VATTEQTNREVSLLEVMVRMEMVDCQNSMTEMLVKKQITNG
jgi:hypothetical protein